MKADDVQTGIVLRRLRSTRRACDVSFIPKFFMKRHKHGAHEIVDPTCCS